MSDTLLRIWLALWRRSAPKSYIAESRLLVRPFVTDAAMRALLNWKPDWKTEAIGAILESRSGKFIDVGANVGQTLLDFLSAPVRSSYLGFEPHIACYQHLATFVATNRLERCEVIPAGLGERTEVSTLYGCSDADSGATMLRELRPRLAVQASSICVFRLDDLPYLFDESGIALIKIDVEGGELNVLNGMEATLRRTRSWMICEVLHRDASADHEPYRQRCLDLMQFIRELGYDAYRIVQDTAGAQIRDLEKVTAFPDVVWIDGESENACDYLFVPASDAAAAFRQLVRWPTLPPS